MSEYFKDKVFLVTGASGGIGRAIAEALLEAGSNVVIMARRENKLKEIRKALPKADQKRVVIAPGDVSRPADCKRAIKAALKEYSHLDGLIHNAGISQRSLAIETDMKVYKQLMEVDYYSAIYFYHAAIMALRESKGHFVGISSMQGLFSTQYRSGYAAAKHALQGFLNGIRLEEHPFGVHVMTVSPGFVQTDISINALSADGKKHGAMDERTQNGLLPDEVARQVLEGMQARKRDIFPAGRLEKFALFLAKRFPGRLDKMLLKTKVT